MKKFYKMFLYFSFIIIAILYYGCSASATLSNIQTSNTYANKLKLKVGLFIPPEIKDRMTTVGTSTNVCSMWKAQVSSGNGYNTAIQSGLSSCVEDLVLSNSPISPESAKSEGYDLYVIPQIVNENASVSVQESFLTNTINSQFQTSVNLKFFDSNGETIFTYTANGSGFNNGSGSCSDIADIMKLSMETSLRQIADNISQSFYGSAQINDFAKQK
jgi:hypothetical protein